MKKEFISGVFFIGSKVWLNLTHLPLAEFIVNILISMLVWGIKLCHKNFHCFDKVSVNADSYQMADNTDSVCTSENGIGS